MGKYLLMLVFVVGLLLCGHLAFALDPLPTPNEGIIQGHVDNYVLVADAHKTISVPNGAVWATFNSTADVWIRIGGTAEVPAGDVTDGTGSELNPGTRFVEGASTIGAISADGAKLSVSFHRR